MDLGRFGVVSCLGASWIGGDLAGTLQTMLRHAEPRAWLPVGEVYRALPPSAELAARYEQSFADLAGTLDVFGSAGVDLVEMVLTNDDDWDRYAASQWLNVANWLDNNPDHPDAATVRAERDDSRRRYLADERGTLGWGVGPRGSPPLSARGLLNMERGPGGPGKAAQRREQRPCSEK